MSFDWSEYLHLARQLAENPTSREASLRSAISRAYYAAFCTARNHLRDKESRAIPGGAQVHRYVREQFQNSADSARKAIGVNLDRLRSFRNKTDYDDAVTGLPSVAAVALSLAEQIIDKVIEVESGP